MIEKCPIEGLLLIQPKVFKDPRGYFLETWNEREYKAAGLTTHFIQDNQSKSKRGVLRGLHFQSKYPQGKLVRVILGEVFDVAVDIREGSPTFGKWYGIILSEEKQNQFYIPPGFAHGFWYCPRKQCLHIDVLNIIILKMRAESDGTIAG